MRIVVMLITGLRRHAGYCQCSSGTNRFLDLCVSYLWWLSWLVLGKLKVGPDPADIPISLA